MKILGHTSTPEAQDTVRVQSPVKVCMHVRGVVRTDGRVMREAAALLGAGFAVTVLDFEDDLTRSIEEDIGGVHVKHIMKPNWLIPVRFRPWRLIRSAQKFVYTTLQLIQTTPDIYHAHEDNALPACYIAAWWHRKPLIFDAHEFPLNALNNTRKRWLSILLTRLFTHMVRSCAGIITVSSPIAQEICDLYHVPHVSLIRNIPAYQTPPKSDQLRHFLGLRPDVRIVLYQGNLQEDRGLDTLVRAAAFLEEGTIIILMGKGIGATQAQLEDLITSEGVGDSVKILPPVPYAELLEWTASADVGLIIYPPDQSLNVRMCLPNKLFEYLMAGLPILASPLDAVAEVIKSYDVGQVLSSLTPADVGAAINAMLTDRAALARMSRNARDAVQRDLNWEKESQELIHLYDAILEMRNKLPSNPQQYVAYK